MKSGDTKKQIDRYRSAFFLVGLILAMFTVLTTMQYTITEESRSADQNHTEAAVIYTPRIPVTERPEMEIPGQTMTQEKVEQIINPNLDKIKIVLNDVPDLTDVGGEEPEEIKPIREVLEGDVIEVPAPLLDRGAIFAGCEQLETEDERERCFMTKIRAAVVDNMEITKADTEFGISGRMFVEFVINTEGYVSEVKVLNAPTAHIEVQAREIIRNLPQFVPGMKDGVYRPSRYTLPIRLRLN